MPSFNAPPPFPGDTVASYTLGDSIGVGGNATVFKAHSPTFGQVAIKILHPGKTSEEDLRRFQREFLSLKTLEHPNIVKVFESGVHNNYPWISMELVEGSDLDSLIRSWEYPIETPQFQIIRNILIQMCRALEYIHAQGIIHRDLKPSNVLITQSGVPKLTDFGVVKNPQQFKSELTTMGSLVGTVAFMAPELIIGEDLDHRADLYSLGALIFMALTGKKPFEAKSIVGYLSQHLTQPPLRPSSEDSNIPEQLDNICFQLLQKNPNNRYSSTADVIHDLHNISRSISLIEREEAETQVRDAFEKWKENESNCVNIIGERGSGRTIFLQKCIQSHAHFNPITINGPDWKLPDLEDNAIICIDNIEQLQNKQLEALQHELNQLTQQGLAILLIYTSLEVHSFELLYHDRINILLNGLTLKGTQKLLRAHNVAGAATVILAKRLCDAFCGLPGHIIETLDLLIEENWISIDGQGKYRTKLPTHVLSKGALPTPTFLQQEIRNKLKPLSSQAKLLIECLAVYQLPSTSSLLCELMQCPESQLQPTLKELFELSWLEEDIHTQSIQLKSQFPNSAIYDILSEERRIIWHRRIASVLRSTARRRISEISEVIAHHLIHSGQPDAAIPYLLMAGQRKLRGQFLKEAEQHFIEVKTLIQKQAPEHIEPKHQHHLHHHLGKVYFSQGQYEDAIVEWQQALAVDFDSEHNRPLLKVQIGLAQIKLKKLSMDIESNIQILPEDSTIRHKALKDIAFFRFEQNAFTEAQEAWNLLALSEKQTNQLIARSGQALLKAVYGDNATALQTLETYHSILGPHFLPHIIEICLVAGHWEKAAAMSADIIERTQSTEDNSLRIKALSYHGMAMLWMGLPLQANTSFQEAGFYMGMLQAQNALDPLIHYARLANWIQVEARLTHEILDSGGQTSVERQYHHALCNLHQRAPMDRIIPSLPWQDCFNRIDHIRALYPHQPEQAIEDLESFWSQLPQNQYVGVEVIIASLGNQWVDKPYWKKRLQESVNACAQKQPTKLQIFPHWLDE